MSAKVLMGPNAAPQDVWEGHAAVDRAGAELAIEMLSELEDTDCDDDHHVTADYSCIADWPREGQPFRNIVAEYLQRARAAGGDVEAGFCAVLGDYVSICCQGSVPDAEGYAQVFGIE